MERILCAAIWYKNVEHKLDRREMYLPNNISFGYVMCGRRHNNIIALNCDLTGNVTRRETSVQGFLTNTNRFVDRIEANKIAIAASQVVGNIEGDELISEDLY